MEQYTGNNNDRRSGHKGQRTGMTEKIPMHPDDFNALLAWIRAKRSHETEFEKSLQERPVYDFEKGPKSHDFCLF
jgi:hypothetical protein